MAEQNVASAVGFVVKIAGTAVDPTELESCSVDLDLSQPDMCAVTLRNVNNKFSTSVNQGDPVIVTAGEGDTEIFNGEAVGIEPVYRADGNNTVTIRAFNRLHRLLRGRKSRTFLEQSDQDIAGKVAGDHGLSPKAGSSPKITHKHVYQHNQTDLEFLRVRAARIGFEVWVEGQDLYFDAPKKDKVSSVKMRYGDAKSAKEGGEVFIKHFAPRISSAGVVEKVTVRGWDPIKKEEIVGEATSPGSKLGSKTGDKAASSFGAVATFEVDHPIFSVQEAQEIAKAKLDELLMGYITGEGECRGTPELKPGVVVPITVNPDKADDRFNGKYMIVGATHRYVTESTEEGGYVTLFRVSRDAEGP